jgi:predicted dinucleotide-binding enzyme
MYSISTYKQNKLLTPPMNIAIIGHGNVGSALAIQWVEAAHEVVIGARQPSGQKVRNLVGRHRDLAATTIEDAVQQSEVILIATPADATVEIAHALGDVNNPRAKEIARQLAKDAGFGEVYDMGSDDKIPLLEQFAMIWINLAISQGYGRNIAFKVMKRSTPA